jgi:uncharacterized protein
LQGDSCDLSVRITPRADREAVTLDGATIRARVSAPPVGGQANAALIKLLSKRLGVPKSALRIVRGETAGYTLVRVGGLSADEGHARLKR